MAASTLATGETLQAIAPAQNLILNSTGDLVGIRNTNSTGADFRGGSGGVAALTVRTVSATAYTFVSGDNNNAVDFTAATGVTITLPAGLGSGFNVAWIQSGAGQLTFSPSGTTMNNFNGHTKSAGQYAAGSLIARAADVFNLSGVTGV